MEKFKYNLSLVDWSRIYEIKEVNIAYKFLEPTVTEELDSQIPVKKFQIRSNFKGLGE